MSDIYYTYASREELLAAGADSNHIYEDDGHRHATLTKEQCHSLIPHGEYCYSRKDEKFAWCPFHDIIPSMPKQSNGFCHYIKRGDFTSPGTNLLWDDCKECNVNIPSYDDYLISTSCVDGHIE